MIRCLTYSFFILFLFLPCLVICCVFHNGTAPSQPIRTATALNAELTANQKEIQRIQEKWSEVRAMSKEDAASLEGEWKEAHDRYFTKYENDMDRMLEIAGKLKELIEPPRVLKKTEGQRRRDKWAIVQARTAYRAANVKTY